MAAVSMEGRSRGSAHQPNPRMPTPSARATAYFRAPSARARRSPSAAPAGMKTAPPGAMTRMLITRIRSRLVRGSVLPREPVGPGCPTSADRAIAAAPSDVVDAALKPVPPARSSCAAG